MTTQAEQPGTALAVPDRQFTPAQLKQRIELNKRANFGLERATPAQLNVIYVLCERYRLDPLTDMTLYEGRPWITIDGRLRLLRRHEAYRGYDCRPLTKDEKGNWGYDVADIVVECTIRTTTWGEVKARGKVTRAEIDAAQEKAKREGKKSAPVGLHPVEIAEKRAIGRCERAAFGQDAVVDEEDAAEEVRFQIQERTDPERVQANAATYDRIYASEADMAFPGMPETPPAAVVDDDTPAHFVDEPAAEAPAEAAAEQVTSKRHSTWRAWVDATRDATANEIKFPEVELPIDEADLLDHIDTLRQLIAEKLGARTDAS